MSYQAFYRKLRPARFADIIGQEHVVTTLRNQLMSRRVAHAYLFVGTRGTGKTSMAKIFARAINCEASDKGEPCGICPACAASRSGASANVLEIDAASNNSVDNIRELRDEIQHAPISGVYKVLIIDEVHMLSTGAFNALLKTLEEPPAHVYFILATTEAQKIPATILSRCQRFDFRRVSPREMTAALRGYMDGEGVRVTDDALDYVAELSDGAMRDALSLLDRAASLYGGTEITRGMLRDLMGAVDGEVYVRLTAALQTGDNRACLGIIDEAAAQGRDITQFVNEYVRHLRGLMITASADASPELAGIVRFLTHFAELAAGLRHSVNERVSLEVACIKLCLPQAAPPLQAAQEGSAPAKAPAQAPTATKAAPAAAKQQNTPAVPEDVQLAIRNFGALAERLKMPVKKMLRDSTPRYTGGDCLTIAADEGSVATLERNKGAIKAELAAMFKKDIDVVIVSASGLAGGKHSTLSARNTREHIAEVFGEDIVEFS
ncbi:MAG: DNA polymerase III subunit gamma/tau [Defluviitaleaceae bacterium]|nr:DNA polymerase III subunit gamma/tau [Defluviitaleaceae bacterium]